MSQLLKITPKSGPELNAYIISLHYGFDTEQKYFLYTKSGTHAKVGMDYLVSLKLNGK